MIAALVVAFLIVAGIVALRATSRFHATIVVCAAIAVAPLLRAFGAITPRRAGIAIAIVLLVLLPFVRNVGATRRQLGIAFGIATMLALVAAAGIILAWCFGWVFTMLAAWPALLLVFSIWPEGYDQGGHVAQIAGPVAAIVTHYLAWMAIITDALRRKKVEP